MALVVYVRRARFVPCEGNFGVAPGGWEPWALLGLPRETENELLACLPPAGAGGSPLPPPRGGSGATGSPAGAANSPAGSAAAASAAAAARRRTRLLRDAYMDLAARFHPDAGGGGGWQAASAAPWLPRSVHFAAVAAAARALSDPVAALACLRACLAAEEAACNVNRLGGDGGAADWDALRGGDGEVRARAGWQRGGIRAQTRAHSRAGLFISR